MEKEFFKVEANFPNPNGGWREVYNIGFELNQAKYSLRHAKRDNPELEFRLVNCTSGEVTPESEVLGN